MPEMKNSFQKGRMNKDLDERIVPSGEYRDALNVEVSTSEDSNVGTLQTLKGNLLLQGQDWFDDGVCVGSIADNKNDKLYFMIAGSDRDLIVEYSHSSQAFAPVCVSVHMGSSLSILPLKFHSNNLITGINIIDDMLFWTDNNSEPKRINISRGKAGSSNFINHTKVVVKNTSGASQYVNALDDEGAEVFVQEKHLTVIRQGPPAAPVLEMIDTERGDQDGDGDVGGYEINRSVTITGEWLDLEGEFNTPIVISMGGDLDGDGSTSDLLPGDFINIYAAETYSSEDGYTPGDSTVKVRLEIISQSGGSYTCEVLSGDKDIVSYSDYMVELEQPNALFEFKYPRFACRYKYEDGEYSPYSPFTEPAFLPGTFNYISKEGYNLGMINRVRKLVIKDFVHTRLLPEDVVSIDILYKESNSPNIYSVKTIKKRIPNLAKWDEWNAISSTSVIPGPTSVGVDGWNNKTKGYLPITSEMIHAALPANQLLRPWDNVPRKALGQEIVGNRLVYGNYLQNYNLSNEITLEKNIKVDIQANIRTWDIGDILPEEVQAGPNMKSRRYKPAKSIKSLRTYQLGVLYIDQYGRETPVFSEDKIGTTGSESLSHTSLYNKKINSSKKSSLNVRLKNNPPDWATHFKYFIKETSNEYYNLAMDRWYNAEDGNIWLSFPSSERNKLEEGIFMTLKKAHDSNDPVSEKARYKVLAISNEAPRFIKLQNISIGSITDVGTTLFGDGQGDGFPLVGQAFITIEETAFKNAGWESKLMEDSIAETYMRMRSNEAVSKWYAIKDVSQMSTGFYKIQVKEAFKEDMSLTSSDNTYLFGVNNLVLQIVKREEVDKAEFDGRFFAKILRDNTIVKYLGINMSSSIAYQIKETITAQYINPLASEGSDYTWDGFGANKWKISIDENQNKLWNQTDSGALETTGNGQAFWKMASNSKGEHTAIDESTTSRGWFIDKVEAFRPFKGQRYHYNGTSKRGGSYGGFRWNPCSPTASGVTTSSAWDDIADVYGALWATNNRGTGSWYRQPEIGIVNVMGLNTYGGNGNGYLGENRAAKPSGPNNESAIASVSNTNGGGVARPVGIQNLLISGKEVSIVNLSYSGIGEVRTSAWKGVSGDGNNTLDKLNSHNLQNDTLTEINNSDDIKFIQLLTSPGTLWKWEEDPGNVIYKTVEITGLPSSGDTEYTQAQWTKETVDYSGLNSYDDGPGVSLFNYTIISDWIERWHHRYSRKIYLPSYINGTYDCTWYGCCQKEKSNGKADFVSRYIKDHCGGYGQNCQYGIGECAPGIATTNLTTLYVTGIFDGHLQGHLSLAWDTANGASEISTCLQGSLHNYWPMGVYDWNERQNKRRRFVFAAEVAFDNVETGASAGDPLGSVGPHYYLPTNDCNLPSHFDYGAVPITAHPITGVTFDVNSPAPGIRADGMYSGYDIPTYLWHDGFALKEYSTIPKYKRWDSLSTSQSAVPGSVSWQVLEPYVEEADGSARYSSTNPAIWETEPREDVGLDIYHEIGQIYPIYLDDNTIEQFVGAIGSDVTKNSYVQCWDPPYVSVPGATASNTTISLSTGSNKDIRVSAAYDRFVQLSDVNDVVLGSVSTHTLPSIGSYLIFWRADGGTTEAHVRSMTTDSINSGTWFELSGNLTNGDVGVHNKMIILPWFNCYSFGNGVESDRIRDDFNQVTIDNGPKVSTTIEGPYLEDRRKSGFIWSGIYNSTSGVNNLNQFIQAEAITKDVNPSYGSIQKLSVRDSDLVAFCEDRVLKVLADKDALYNADGNTNVVTTSKVLGTAKPFIGDYGISKNPESFASDSYRSYFTDTSRGAVVRLSQDGLTPISDAGMKDWFSDNLQRFADANLKIIGSFDDKKQEYNISINTYNLRFTPPLKSTTISYSESSKGWVSFKSFIKENGVSLNNNYYTLKSGKLYQHHVNEVRNEFYGNQFDSSVDTLLNQSPSSIKSFSTLNYEGSQAKVSQDTLTNPDYYDNIPKDGWYVKEMTSNAQELGEMEFWDKEDKWFSQIKGVKTKWLNDGTAGNIDPREFSYQGIGNVARRDCPECPDLLPSWNCIPGYYNTTYIPGTPGTPGTPEIPGTPGTFTNSCSTYNEMTPGTAYAFFGAYDYYSTLSNGISINLHGNTTYGDIGAPSSGYCFSTGGVNTLRRLSHVTVSVSSSGVALPGMPQASYAQTFSWANVLDDLITAGYAVAGDNRLDVMANAAFISASGTIGVGTSPCTCTTAIPGTPTIPAVPEVLGTPATDPIPVNTWVPGYCEEVTTFPSNGEFPSLAMCEDTCLIPPTWNCLTATPIGWPNNPNASIPINYCNEENDGTGTFTSLSDCEENCPEYEVISPTWNCVQQDTPTGATLGCEDPGDGNGQYTSLISCEENCMEPTMIGPCDINDATIYDNNLSYMAGDVVLFMNYYYYAVSAVGAGFGGPDTLGSQWAPCDPNFIGPCNLDIATTYDPANAYPLGSVVEITNTMGNSIVYWNAYDVPAGGIGMAVASSGGIWHPVEYVDSLGQGFYFYEAYDPIANTTNPWIPCDWGETEIGPCLIGGAMQYDPTVTYGGFNNPLWASQIYGPDQQINVWYQNNLYTLNCEFTWSQIDTNNCCFLADGTEIDGNDMDIIEEGLFNCELDGIMGIAPGQLLQDSNGVDMPGTGYWEPCGTQTTGPLIDNYFGCCDPTATDNAGNLDFGACMWGHSAEWQNCMASGLCDCDPSMCTNLTDAITGMPTSYVSCTGCFAKGDKVEMFDGNQKSIELIKIGDEVKSIKNNKIVKGIVTDSLIHLTNDVVKVVKVNGITSEPNHPVFIDGKWVAAKTLGNITHEFIGNWYNLEVDGDIEDSEHNYIIGGLTVSGLGDNTELNSKYQRQPKVLTKHLK